MYGLVTNAEIIVPMEAIIAPAMKVDRNPNLLQDIVAMGP